MRTPGANIWRVNTRLRRSVSRAGVALVALMAASGLSGCAGPALPGANIDPNADPLACGIVLSPVPAVIGEDLLISRAATAATDVCGSLVAGSTQTLELRSIQVGDRTTSVTVQVEADGSFTTTMPVAHDLRLGRALVTAIPPTELSCLPAATTPDAQDCILPRVYFEVGHNPYDLMPVEITSTDLNQTVPAALAWVPYAVAGPGPNEVTLVLYGNSCPTRPVSFVNTAASGSLEIVSEGVPPEGVTGCADLMKPWTTVILVPDAYAAFDTVKVDNVEAFYER